MVTSDALGHTYDDLRVMTRVNGETRQDDTTGHLLFSFPYLISYLSTFMRLKPGDVISTGTPNGSGARLDPPQYLAPGDVVEVESPLIGVLRNEVVSEAATDG
jgi:5-carboxymethyl-2-hydroxymuconate isomerase